MSVLIREMKMPMNCDECYLYVSTAYSPGCLIESNGIPNRYNYDPKKRPDWCPLVEVKTPHGRLIDADKLFLPQEDIGSKMALSYAPTVVDAEDEE